MFEENYEKKKSKLPILIIVLTLVLALSVGTVYAYFSARATNSGQTITGRTLEIGGTTLTIAASRVTMNPSTTPVSDNLVPAVYGASPTEITTTEVNRALSKQCSLGGYTGCHVWKITASTTQNVASANIRLNLNVAEVTDKQQWSYVVYTGTDSSSDVVLNKGLINSDFGDTTTTIDIHNGAALSANTPAIYYVMVYLNNTNSVQNDGVTVNTTNETGAYNGSVILEAMGGEVKVSFIDTVVEYITNLYTNATKSTVTNNSITYNYATSESLMNDRLGGTTQSLDGGNIRYYGANPNNYLWLGETYTSDYTIPGNVTSWGYADVNACINDGYPEAVCTEDTVRHTGDRKLYRIIGVFDNKLKVIAEDSIGNYSWNTSASSVNNGYGVNEWTEADLMKLLNPGYDSDTVNNSLYWRKASGTCYKGDNNTTTSCDFTNIGLSDNVKNKIVTATWNLGAFNDGEGYANTYYGYERGTTHVSNPADGITRQDSWTGKVGLIYPSDYGYAINFSLCTNKQVRDNSTECLSNNWMHNYSDYWTLSSRSDNPISVWNVDAGGVCSLNYNDASNWVAVRPVFYLGSNEYIESGTGTRSDPYILG